jgi:uncharacterized protein YjbJ (UPF0337 family)
MPEPPLRRWRKFCWRRTTPAADVSFPLFGGAWNLQALRAVLVHRSFLKWHGRSEMNWDRVKGNWKQFQGKVQQQCVKLTNDDLDVVEGNRTELVGRIQERYGIARDDAERQVSDWERKL